MWANTYNLRKILMEKIKVKRKRLASSLDLKITPTKNIKRAPETKLDNFSATASDKTVESKMDLEKAVLKPHVKSIAPAT